MGEWMASYKTAETIFLIVAYVMAHTTDSAAADGEVNDWFQIRYVSLVIYYYRVQS